jgi:hypothetical protein
VAHRQGEQVDDLFGLRPDQMCIQDCAVSPAAS